MVATRRSRSLDVKEEANSCKEDDSSRRSKSARKNTAAEGNEVRCSARLRGVSPLPSSSSRKSTKTRQNVDSDFQWGSPQRIPRRSNGKSLNTSDYPTGLRRSLRRRRLDVNYIEYDRPGIGRKLVRTRSGERVHGGHRKRELTDLLAAQGKNLSDVKLYTEPDIYSSVKSRVRVSTRDKLYQQYFTQGMSKKKPPSVEEESQSEETEEDEDEDEQTNGEEEDDDEEEEEGHPYKLRKVREAPKRYMIVREVQRRRPRSLFEDLPGSPARRRRPPGTPRQVPYHKRRRRARTQGNSSTSDESSTDDEIKFRKRQHKSMARVRNECMPINLSSADLKKHSFAMERKKIGQSLADIDPMGLDTTVKFSSIGGHTKHIRALKEMVVFPLLYPEVFEKFSITPPRGCLFYGPPGTGKTLMARALANECSTDGKKVSFFMKKGADCLSKWIGESERQLRVLFDQAYQMRPSIIFFDEIDGLAPVRSSRQDQIHSSIVSTLLALMDGLDNRGEIIVIGATNRIDSIDPALRRPGRFDREFLFPLPDKLEREAILKIHTKAWNPQLKGSFIEQLAGKTVGYCGADLKALCTEAALIALRRRYPQIYESSKKLQLNVNSISIQASDFHMAIKSIIPAAERAVSSPGRALPTAVQPLLGGFLQKAVLQLAKLFPALRRKSKVMQHLNGARSDTQTNEYGADFEDDFEIETQTTGIFVGQSEIDRLPNPILPLLFTSNNGIVQSQYLSLINKLSSREQSLNRVHRPRFIICGDSLAENASHLVPALLQEMEGMPIHSLDLPSLFGVSVRTPEESCAQLFREARRLSPCIVFLPHAPQWWSVASPTVQATLVSLLQDIPPSSPILFLATANCSYSHLPCEFAKFFNSDFDEVFQVDIKFTSEQRREFFGPIFLIYAVTAPPSHSLRNVPPEELPLAPIPESAPLTKEEEEMLEKEEESTMRNLRLFLRDVLMRLERDRRFKIFSKPVDFEEVPDYVEVIKKPMDFSTMQTKIDQHKYQTAGMFLEDIVLICNNALEYNPDRRPEDKLIRHRACAMRDMAHAIVDTDLDPEFDKSCHEVVESQKRRGVFISKYAPKFYPVLPQHLMVHPITGEITSKSDCQTQNESALTQEQEHQVEKSPWRTRVKRPQSTSKGRRKRSSWSRGIVGSAKKKRKIIPASGSSEDEEDKEESEKPEEDAGSQYPKEHVQREGKGSGQSSGDEDNGEVGYGKKSCQERDSKGKGILSVSFENGTEMEISIGQDSGKDSLLRQEQDLKTNGNSSDDPRNGSASDDNFVEDDTDGVEDGLPLSPKLEELLEQPMSDMNSEEVPGKDTAEPKELEGVTETDSSTTSEIVVSSKEALFDANDLSEVSEEYSQHNGSGPDVLELVETEEVVPARQRMTLRSRSTSEPQSPYQKPARKPPPPPLVVDYKELLKLLEELVEATEFHTLEELERTHASLSRCVEKYRMEYDRTSLTEDLRREIHEHCSVMRKVPRNAP